MSISEYLIDLLLIAIVARQIRESRLSWHSVLLPVGACVYVGTQYLHALPTAGNDLPLIAGFTAIGLLLGVVSALTTRVRRDERGRVLVKAGAIAAGAWVLGMGFRFGFSIWAAHGGGGSLMHFSAAHDITSADAWTDALVLMAFTEVFARTALLVLRGHRTAPAADPKQALAPIGS